MRILKGQPPLFYGEYLANIDKAYPEFSKDLLEDIFIAISFGKNSAKYLKGYDEIHKELSEQYIEGHIFNLRKEEAEVTKIKTDLIDFIESDFLKNLIRATGIALEKRFELVLDSLKSFMEASQGNSPGQNQNIKRGFQGFSYLMNFISPDMEGKEAKPGERSTTRELSYENAFLEMVENKVLIADLANKIFNFQNSKIFEIARNIGFSIQSDSKGIFKDTEEISSNIFYSKMRKLEELNRSHLMELHDDKVFDLKFMRKNLKVKHYKKRSAKKQCLYILADKSSSTADYHRQIFIKAVMVALAKKSLEEKGKFFCRWFDGGVKSLINLDSREFWKTFIDYTINSPASGGTDIHFAIYQAFQDIADNDLQDIDSCDLLIITDGESDLNHSVVGEIQAKKKELQVKMHFIVLEEIGNPANIKRVSDSLQYMDSRNLDLTQEIPSFREVIDG